MKAGFDPHTMKFSVADLLDQLSYDQPVSQTTLAKILKLSNKADKERQMAIGIDVESHRQGVDGFSRLEPACLRKSGSQ